jgi:lysyl-tRNA synthetase class 1
MTEVAYLRSAVLASKAWPYEEARKLLKRWPDCKPAGAPMGFETAEPQDR